METKDFIEKIIDQFDETPNEKITVDTVMRDIEGWSSFVALSVMAMCDEEYEVQLKADEMRNARTIGELYEIVKSRKG